MCRSAAFCGSWLVTLCKDCCCVLFVTATVLAAPAALLFPRTVHLLLGRGAHILLGTKGLLGFEGLRAIRHATVCSLQMDPGGCAHNELVATYAATYGWELPGVAVGATALGLYPVHFSHAAYKAVAYDVSARRSMDMLVMANTTEFAPGLLPIGTTMTLMNLDTGHPDWLARRELLADAFNDSFIERNASALERNVTASADEAAPSPSSMSLFRWLRTRLGKGGAHQEQGASDEALIMPPGVVAGDLLNRDSIMRVVGLNLFKWMFNISVVEDLGGLLEHCKALRKLTLGSFEESSRASAQLARIRAPIVAKVLKSDVGTKFVALAKQKGMDADARLREAIWLTIFFGQIGVTDLVHSAVQQVLSDKAKYLPLLRGDPDGFLLEVARLSPPIGGMNPFVRKEAGELALGNGRLLAWAPGDLAFLSAASANRDPAVFANPDAFSPGRHDADRLLSWNAELRDIRACGPRGAMVNCSTAPRPCPGTHLSLRLARAVMLFFADGLERRKSIGRFDEAFNTFRSRFKPMENGKNLAAAAVMAEAALKRAPRLPHVTSTVVEEAKVAAELAARRVLQSFASTVALSGNKTEIRGLGSGLSVELNTKEAGAAYKIRTGSQTARIAADAAASADAATHGVFTGAAALSRALNESDGKCVFTVADRGSVLQLHSKAKAVAQRLAEEAFAGVPLNASHDNASIQILAQRAGSAAEATATSFFDSHEFSFMVDSADDLNGHNETNVSRLVEITQAVAADVVRNVLDQNSTNEGMPAGGNSTSLALVALEAAVGHVLCNSIQDASMMSTMSAWRKVLTKSVSSASLAVEEFAEKAAHKIHDGLVVAEQAAGGAYQKLKRSQTVLMLRRRAQAAAVAADTAIHKFLNSSAGQRMHDRALAAAAVADAALHSALDGLHQAELAVEGVVQHGANVTTAVMEKAKVAAETAVHNILAAEHATEEAARRFITTTAPELANRTKIAADAAVQRVLREAAAAGRAVKRAAMGAERTMGRLLRDAGKDFDIAKIWVQQAMVSINEKPLLTRFEEKAKAAAKGVVVSFMAAERVAEGFVHNLANRSLRAELAANVSAAARAAAHNFVDEIIVAEVVVGNAVHDFREHAAKSKLVETAEAHAEAALHEALDALAAAGHFIEGTLPEGAVEKVEASVRGAVEGVIKGAVRAEKLLEGVLVKLWVTAKAVARNVTMEMSLANAAVEDWVRNLANSSFRDELAANVSRAARLAAHNFVDEVVVAEAAAGSVVHNLRDKLAAARLADSAATSANAAVEGVLDTVVATGRAATHNNIAESVLEAARHGVQDALHAVEKLHEIARTIACGSDGASNTSADKASATSRR